MKLTLGEVALVFNSRFEDGISFFFLLKLHFPHPFLHSPQTDPLKTDPICKNTFTKRQIIILQAKKIKYMLNRPKDLKDN